VQVPATNEEQSESESQLDRWWQRDRNVAAIVFGVALILRLLHLREIAIHDPFYTIASVDGAIYDAWAREILAGDWLGDGVLFLGPLYPTFMAAVYALFGPSLPALKVVQAVLGAGACVLFWGVARELFDRRVAALAGAFAALYKMHIFYGATVMIVNLQVALVAGLVWASLRALRNPSFRGWALCGLLLGLAALGRQTVLLMAPILALWTLFGMKGTASFGRRVALGTTFGVVILALILPFTLKNYVAGDDLVLLNSTGGANFYMGNRQGVDGTWQLPPLGAGVRVDNPRRMRDAFKQSAEKATGETLKPSEVSSYWMARGLDEIKKDPLRWLRLEARKLGLFFNTFEVWNNRSVDVSEQFSWVLRAPSVEFGFVVPLGLVGLALSVRRWREFVPVHAALFAYLLGALLFFVLSRYRLPGIMLFIPFAAFACVDLIQRLRNRQILPAAVSLVLLIVFTTGTRLPLNDSHRMHMAYYNLGNKYRELERWDEAVDAYHDSLAEFSGAISTHNNLALSLEGAGRHTEAIAAWMTVGKMALRNRDQVRMERSERHLKALTADAESPEASPSAQPHSPGDMLSRGL
jgi:4-amino-4-deoxy-L-arabinose transferase-like glycosyltransferase